MGKVVPIIKSWSKHADEPETDFKLVIFIGWVKDSLLSGSRIPMIELMVRMTSMQFEVLGSCSRIFLRLSGTVRFLAMRDMRFVSSS